MSLPCNDRVRSFYGKSYPTLARGSITKEGGSGEADRTGLASADAAVAPLLEWAKNATWKMGGDVDVTSLQKRPKQPFTPLYAFVAAKQLKLKKDNPYLSASERLAIAKADAAEEWENLTSAERDVYQKLADEDVQRFEEEMAKYKEEHPQQSSRRRKAPPRKPATKPKAPLTAWRAFVQRELLKQVDSAPEKQGHMSLQNQIAVMKELAPIWKNMSDKDKWKYEQMAAEDRKRWEGELDKFPDYKAQLAKKAAARTQQAAERNVKKRNAKPKPKSKQRVRVLPKATARPRPRRSIAPTETNKKLRKARKQAIWEEASDESEEESEEEEEEPDLGDSDSADELPSDADKDAEDAEQEDDEEEEEEPVAATPANQAIHDEEEEEGADDEDEQLRGAKNPEDLMPASQGDGVFGWAASILKSGIKSVWHKRAEQHASEERPARRVGNLTSQTSEPARQAKELSGEALVGATFVKEFDGRPYTGQVDEYIAKHNWYAVSYPEDGDSEELTHEEMMALLRTAAEKTPAAKGKRTSKKRKR